MGGLALSHTGTRRYQKDEYNALVAEVLPKVKEAFKTKAEVVVSYRNKESFGDMDILVLNDELKNAREVIETNFNPTDIFKNGNVVSFDYKNFQIDLIFTIKENWETSKVFFAYNDLGNLMGKIFHRMDLSYGHKGLFYVYNEGNKVTQKIQVSKNMPKIFEFIGLSWEKFQEGFDDLEDIFEYVITSPLFNPEIFKMENLNSTDRRRNKRRKVFQEFLKYVKDIEPKYEFEKDRTLYRPLIADYFPESFLLEKIEDIIALRKKQAENREKFNGDLVMKYYPELTGKLLGHMMLSFKNIVTNNGITFDDYLYAHTSGEIFNDFEMFFRSQQKTYSI